MRAYRSLTSVQLLLLLFLLVPLKSGWGQDGPSLCVDEIWPDLCPVQEKLYETYLWYDGGSTYLRLSNGIANVGAWELYFYPTGTAQSGKRAARQRVGCVTVDDDTLTKYYTVGEFEYHDASCHDHIHLGELARYSIRSYSGTGSSPGSTLAVGEKVGFCLADSDPYQEDTCCGPVQGTAPENPVFSTSCPYDINANFHEGISVGWQDEYRYYVTEQWVNIDSIPSPGPYWLQSVVDPDQFIKQQTRTNDTARIPIFIVHKDLYESNDSKTAVDAMGIGGAASSHLSACRTSVDSLSIHREMYFSGGDCFPYDVEYGDVDYFKIHLTDTAGSADSVWIRFADSSGTAFHDGNLDLELRNSNDSVLVLANSNNNDEAIALNNRLPGTYYLKVYGRQGTLGSINPYYNSNYYYRLELSLPTPVCGDVNGDGVINSSDVIVLGNCCPSCNSGNVPCIDQADLDGDCDVDCADRDILIQKVYYSGSFPGNACSCQ